MNPRRPRRPRLPLTHRETWWHVIGEFFARLFRGKSPFRF